MAKRRIAVLGGGVGAMTAAFQITEIPGWEEQFEITVYQMGWRLGGKGASGRDLAGNAEIQEHGLHVWFGFYENAFSMIRKVYEAAAPIEPGSPFRSWTDAFQPQTRITLTEFVGAERKLWPINFPQRGDSPGDGVGGDVPTPWSYVVKLLEWMSKTHAEVRARVVSLPVDPQHLDVLRSHAESLSGELRASVAALLPSNSAADLLELARKTAAAISSVSQTEAAHFAFLLQLLTYFLEIWIQPIQGLSDDVRRLAIVFDLAVAIIRGMINSGVIFSGFDVINDRDYIAWLKDNGAKHTDSALVRYIYDALFAYRAGDSNQPNIEAGTALRGQLRILFDYRGAVAFRMNAGMGDTIFAPLYNVLKNRNVKFEFFQRVKNLSLSPDHKRIDRISIDVQALTNGNVPYNPLVEVKGLPCWPATPLYDQLQNPDQLRPHDLESWYSEWHDKISQRELVSGQDFDDVVLGIPVGALPYVCPELISVAQNWRNMVTKIETVQTQGLQMWLQKSASDLGWEGGAVLPPSGTALACGYVEPFDTYADMSHLIPREDWLPTDYVQHIGYFCNCLKDEVSIPAPFTDSGFPGRELLRVQQNAQQFLERDAIFLWPKGGAAGNPAAIDPILVRKTFLKVNIDPPERYVLSVAGSSAFRLDPGNSGFQNLYLAGDWTRSGLNGGCVEGAVMSGMAAAQALTGSDEHPFGFGPPQRFSLNLNAPRTVGNGDEIRKYWKQQAAAKLPPEPQVIARNAAITAAYMEMYQAQRALYKWSGLASFASHRVGLLLLAYDFTPDGVMQITEHATGKAVPEGLRADLDLIRQMNNAVYDDVAWALLAYRAVGLDPVLAGLESLPDHGKMVSGFRQIDQGRQAMTDPSRAADAATLIWAGNQDLLFHEQNVVLQPGYDRMNFGFEEALSFATSMDFNTSVLNYDSSKFTSFPLFMTTEGLLVLAANGLIPNIANFNQRWYWVSRRIFPMWKSIDADSGSSPAGVRHEAVLLQEKVKADLHRIASLWQIGKGPR